MGRTKRSRCRRKGGCNYNISYDPIFINIMKWLKNSKWFPTCDLQPVSYKDCGRGLMTKKRIKKGEVVFSLPYNLLITSDTVEDSPVACVFHCTNELNAQDVLSLFLVWEKQHSLLSEWNSYIKTLPTQFSLPLFCSDDELVLMPSFISSAVEDQKKKIVRSFRCILETLNALELCQSCRRKPCKELICMNLSYNDFLWAWTVVNTRSVYCENKRVNDYSIKITDSHCIALAPLLDMFNHSNESDLKAELTLDGHYQIKATGPIAKYSQVFIHYGHHSNLHLYLQYGFVIPDNIFDVVIFSSDEVFTTIQELFPSRYSYSSVKKTFVSSHNLCKDLICSSEGISFNIRALIYLITSLETEKYFYQKKIYSDSYNDDEMVFIISVGLKLIEKKTVEFTKLCNIMNNRCYERSESFTVGVLLVEHLICMLNKAKCMYENYSPPVM